MKKYSVSFGQSPVGEIKEEWEEKEIAKANVLRRAELAKDIFLAIVSRSRPMTDVNNLATIAFDLAEAFLTEESEWDDENDS